MLVYVDSVERVYSTAVWDAWIRCLYNGGQEWAPLLCPFPVPPLADKFASTGSFLVAAFGGEKHNNISITNPSFMA